MSHAVHCRASAPLAEREMAATRVTDLKKNGNRRGRATIKGKTMATSAAIVGQALRLPSENRGNRSGCPTTKGKNHGNRHSGLKKNLNSFPNRAEISVPRGAHTVPALRSAGTA
jgi:hypothetical protein